jgi:tRNA (guanine10-N2)-dimethyltransferase
MGLMFELSGEHPDMPTAEAIGALEAVGAKVTSIIQSPGVLVVEGDGVVPELAPELAKRLALTRKISRFQYFCELEEVAGKYRDIDISGDSFCIRAKAVHGLWSGAEVMAIQKELGARLSNDYKVDLEKPEQTVQVILSNLAYIGVVLEDIPGRPFEKRKVQNRPFFSPISLHPKLARAQVNIARAPRGGTVLDPFCGTGGILIEAGLMGMKVVGGDLEEKMVKGTDKNVRHFKAGEPLLFQGDVGDLPKWLEGLDEKVTIDAVATDPPYGRSTRTFGEDLKDLYERTFEAMAKVLAKGRYMSITFPEADMPKDWHIEAMGFSISGHYPYRVHKSLTRNFMVFRRK